MKEMSYMFYHVQVDGHFCEYFCEYVEGWPHIAKGMGCISRLSQSAVGVRHTKLHLAKIKRLKKL